MTDTAANPLLATNIDSVTALFDRDPLTLTDAELDRLIGELRSRADAHKAELARKEAAPKASRTKTVTSSDPAAQALRDTPVDQLDFDAILAKEL